MKSLKSFPTFILLLTFNSNAFAVCNQERRRYSQANRRCEHLSAASQGSGAVGAIFAIPTFGLSLLPSIGTGVAASNACRIRDERRSALARCETHAAELARRAVEDAREAIENELSRQRRIEFINQNFARCREQTLQHFEQVIRWRVRHFVNEGWDIENLGTQEELRRIQAEIEEEQNQVLDQLQMDHQRALQDV